MVKVWRKLYVAFFAFTVVLNIYLLRYIYNISTAKDCECAADYRRTFIVYYLAGTLAFSVIMVGLYAARNIRLFDKLEAISLIVILPGSLVYTLFTFQYVKLLKERNCTCTQTIERAVLQLVSTFVAGLLSFSGIIFTIAFLGAGWFVLKKF